MPKYMLNLIKNFRIKLKVTDIFSEQTAIKTLAYAHKTMISLTSSCYK